MKFLFFSRKKVFQPAQEFEKRASRLEAEASQKLGRPLAPRERNGFRNAGSFMMLELIEDRIDLSETATSVAQGLEEWALTLENRYTDGIERTIMALQECLERPLEPVELVRVGQLSNLSTASLILEQLQGAKPHVKEKLFVQLVFAS